MMKVINPLNRQQDNTDSVAYWFKCNCTCNVASGNHNGAENTAFWIPWQDCSCSCSSSNTNKEYNRADASGN